MHNIGNAIPIKTVGIKTVYMVNPNNSIGLGGPFENIRAVVINVNGTIIAISTSTSPKALTILRILSDHNPNINPPKPVPSKKINNIVGKTYATLSTKSIYLIQITSQAKPTKPLKKAISKRSFDGAKYSLSCDISAIGVSLINCSSIFKLAIFFEIEKIRIAIIMLMIIAVRLVLCKPRVSIIQNPAARQPIAAPKVLILYKIPICLPIFDTESVTIFTKTGRVVPIRKHGMPKIAIDKPNLAKVLIRRDSGDRIDNVGTIDFNQSRIIGIKNAQRAINTCTEPNTTAWFLVRSANFPPYNPPIPIPAIYAHNTMLMA